MSEKLTPDKLRAIADALYEWDQALSGQMRDLADAWEDDRKRLASAVEFIQDLASSGLGCETEGCACIGGEDGDCEVGMAKLWMEDQPDE